MRARVAASGIRDGVLGGASVRVTGGAVVVFLGGVFEAVELDAHPALYDELVQKVFKDSRWKSGNPEQQLE